MNIEFIEKLKVLSNIEIGTHSGSYELVSQGVLLLSKLKLSIIDVSDLEMLFQFGNLKHGKTSRDKNISASHLLEKDKDFLLALNEKISMGNYTNSGLDDTHKSNGNCGLFSKGLQTLLAKSDRKTAQAFVKMLIDISKLPDSDTDRIFEIAADCLSEQLSGLGAGIASQILHLLKPNVFPILNSVGQDGYVNKIGLPLHNEKDIENYIDNVKTIKEFRDKELPTFNYRTIDVALWSLSKEPDNINYWLGGATYNAGDMSSDFISSGVYAIDFGEEDISKIVSNQSQFGNWIDNLQNINAKYAFELFSQMKFGDKIAIKAAYAKGSVSMLRIKAIGTVLENFANGYSYNSELGHTLPVEWAEVNPNVDYKIGGYMKTIHKLTRKEDIEKIFYPEISTENDHVFSVEDILDFLGGLKQEITILKQAKLFELNNGTKVLIRTSKLLKTGYFYGLQKAIVDSNETIDYLVLARGNDGFYKIPYKTIVELCYDGSFSLSEKRENAEGYRLYVSLIDGVYQFKIPGGKPPLEIEKYFTKFQYTKEDFLNEVYMETSKYDEIGVLLERKKNIILQGAPGVGKSFLARRLAYSIIGQKNAIKVEMVQFHQSYSYEDFIEGFRPSASGNFTLQKGAFFKFCENAKKDRDNKYFFIIDEINRGNLSKIMGELMLLLENDKRGAEFAMPLTYSGDHFYVPENVYVIGMMNTADRSLAMMDYALRRRFSFVPIEPAFDNELFISNFKENYYNAKNIIEKMKKLNQLIDAELGDGHKIGHSYFCTNKPFTEGDIDGIFKYEISELLREYFFDNESKLNEAMGLL